MNRKVKEIIKGITIFAVTLTIGFMVTAVSFNLFDELTRNQMRLLFAADIITLLAIGSGAWFMECSVKQKEKRLQELENRHIQRVSKRENEMREINIIASGTFVA